MPTYQYACTNSDEKHRFEVVQSFTDAPVSECPECGSTVRKVYGSVGVVFKGSGFYRTDSRTKSPSSESSSSNGTKDGGTKDGGTKDGGTKNGGTKNAAPAAASASSSSSSGSGSSSSSAATG